MKTSLKTVEGLKRSLSVELPIEKFNEKLDQILKKLAKDAKIDGFRKGKVPVAIIRQRFGAAATTDATNDVINDTLGEAFVKEKLNPAGQPLITEADASDKKVFKYTVEFEVYPEVKINKFSDLEFEQFTVKISKEDEKKTLDTMLEQSTEYTSVKRKSKDGDQVTIDFKGFIEDKPFDGGEAKDFKLIIGKNTMIPGFEEKLIGIEAGKSTSFEVPFPKDYQAADLAGKKARFDINVSEVAAPKTPKADDKFAKKFGEKSMDALTKSIKEQMKVQSDNRLHKMNKDNVFNALLAANEFDVPEAAVQDEAKNLAEDMKNRMKDQGFESSKGDFSADLFTEDAKRRVRLGLLVGQIASENKLEASEKQINEKLELMSLDYGENAEQMLNYYKNSPEHMRSVELLVVEQMVMDLVCKDAKIKNKPKKYFDVAQQIQ
jgi:trigger factor